MPSSAGSTGNSIKSIDPRTGVVGTPVFIGSEPTRLAMANDGHTLYAALDGAFAVRRFDTATQTAGAQFTTSYTSNSRYKGADLAVSPDDPNVVAVARVNVGFSPPGEGVAVFNNGTQLSQTTPGHSAGSDSIVFSPVGTMLYGSGQYSGLKRINVTGTGATVASSSTVASGTKIKHSGGKIFSSKGDVADAATSALLGVLPGTVNTQAFVPDMAVGRAYYLVKDTTAANTWILKAYDVGTFTLAGSLTISGVSGDAASLVRWGGNGLAFRTTGGQLFILQTDLIPSGEPIPTSTATPTPTVTPSGTSLPTRFGSVPVFANNLVYHTANKKIYASVPSSMGSSGNSVAIIDPEAAVIENRVYIGSEPNKLALSSDNQKLYVGLDGARQVREFNISDQTAGTQFSAGVNSREGPWTIGDLVASPDDPNQIAISRFSAATTAHGGDAIFDGGVARPSAGGESGSLAYSATSSTLYGLSSQATLEIMPVTGTGTSAVTEVPFDYSGFHIKSIKYSNGLVYNSKGAVLDPATRALAGTYNLSLEGSISANTLFVIDNEHNRILFLVTLLNQGTYLRAYELDTFLPIGSIGVPVTGTVTDMERWGSNGLAISQSNAQILLIESELINPNVPIPAVTPTPFPPTPTPTPPPPPVFLRRVDQFANDMALNPADGKLYVSVPGVAIGGTGNTITRISPQTGEILSSVFVGSEPVKLGMADDGQTLYVGLNGPKAIRRYDMSTQTAGLQFSYTLGSATTYAQDLGVVPGSPDSLVIGTVSGGAAIYDNGIKRPLVPTRVGGPQIAPIGPLEFSSPGILYGYNTGDTGFDLYKVSVVPNGLSTVSSIGNLITGFSQALSDMKFAEGRIYTTTGRVVNPETNTITGTFPNASGKSVAVDTALRRVFIAVGTGISVYDMDTYLK